MGEDQERELFEQYSQGKLTRFDLEKKLGREAGFGDVLLKLYEYELPLPRPQVDRNSPGVQLVKRLAQRAAHG